MVLNDYRSESGIGDSWPDFQSLLLTTDSTRPSASSLIETEGFRAIDAMAEFRLNGVDSPYEPDEEVYPLYPTTSAEPIMGVRAPGPRDRRKSWAAPAGMRTVPARADRALYSRSYSYPGANSAKHYTARSLQAPEQELPSWSWDMLTEQQFRALNSLPNQVIYYLLAQFEQHRASLTRRARQDEVIECRFCKNNGEQESFCRSHRLRYEGKVQCPVLRAYRCGRCGASGDSAHTLKYCPLATPAERSKCNAMMLSLRNRRSWQAPSNDTPRDYVQMGEAPRTVINDGSAYAHHQPLDPNWEALANKLTL